MATKDKRVNRSNITSPSEMSFPSSVKSIIWATGFRYNFDWVKLKLTDKNGHPIQKRGKNYHTYQAANYHSIVCYPSCK